MKKAKLFLDKFFIIQLSKFLLLQVLFAVVTITFGGGGHGTAIPAVILYGPILILLSPLSSVIDSVPVSFLLILAIFLAIFLLFYFKFPTKDFLKSILIFHFISVALMVLYMKLNYSRLSSVSLKYEVYGIIISLFLSFLFWRIFFQVLKYRSKSTLFTPSSSAGD